ncbi:MAG TPA: hypothetical protein VMW01_14990 [Williamwhitmania sp.]|nr:hypothetical protein [Williamwhitmania sp.]
MLKKLLYFVSITVMMSGCSSCVHQGNVDLQQSLDVPDTVIEDQTQFDPNVVQDMVQNIASPVEISALFKSLKAPFSKDYLAPTKNVDAFNTSFRKSIGLGIYGADLGYINMYGKTLMVVDYISAIKTLADGIKVGQFFDFSTLKRLSSNDGNIDSLIFISTSNFNKIDAYLKETNRSSLSSVIIAGVWIEGLYLSCQVASSISSPELNEYIGEQKIAFQTLYLVLSHYKKDPNIGGLVDDLSELKSIYDEITITYEVGEPKTIEKNGVITFVQNDKSNVNISDDQLKRLKAAVEKIRNKLIGA